MILSKRKISEELAFYRALDCRSILTKKEQKKLSVLERGYAGECVYDKVFDDVGHASVFIFRDIYMQIEDSVVQYDALIVSDGGIVVNEVKNFSGDYRYENSKWYYGDFQVPEDAVSQLKRSVGKLLRVKYKMNADFDVSGKLVFPNVEFRLNSNDRELWSFVVMRSNLRQYLSGFRNDYISPLAENIAKEIGSHIVANPYFNKSADFGVVRKGLYCGACRSYDLAKGRYHFVCRACGCKETKESHIIRALSDYKALFLHEKLTKKRFLEFIDYGVSARTVLRMLNRYCSRYGESTGTYYTFNHHTYDEVIESQDYCSRYKNYKGILDKVK